MTLSYIYMFPLCCYYWHICWYTNFQVCQYLCIGVLEYGTWSILYLLDFLSSFLKHFFTGNYVPFFWNVLLQIIISKPFDLSFICQLLCISVVAYDAQLVLEFFYFKTWFLKRYFLGKCICFLALLYWPSFQLSSYF